MPLRSGGQSGENAVANVALGSRCLLPLPFRPPADDTHRRGSGSLIL